MALLLLLAVAALAEVTGGGSAGVSGAGMGDSVGLVGSLRGRRRGSLSERSGGWEGAFALIDAMVVVGIDVMMWEGRSCGGAGAFLKAAGGGF